SGRAASSPRGPELRDTRGITVQHENAPAGVDVEAWEADFDPDEWVDVDDEGLVREQGEEDGDGHGAYEHGPLPVLAVVGRPNVAKSTLVNRIIGRRQAVVEDTPGVTRDRVKYDADWNGRRFTVVDTGGWERDVRGIDAAVALQAEYAIDAADAVLFVVDA